MFLQLSSLLHTFSLAVTASYLRSSGVDVVSCVAASSAIAGIILLTTQGNREAIKSDVIRTLFRRRTRKGASDTSRGTAPAVVFNAVLTTITFTLNAFALQHAGLFKYLLSFFGEQWIGCLVAESRSLISGRTPRDERIDSSANAKPPTAANLSSPKTNSLSAHRRANRIGILLVFICFVAVVVVDRNGNIAPTISLSTSTSSSSSAAAAAAAAAVEHPSGPRPYSPGYGILLGLVGSYAYRLQACYAATILKKRTSTAPSSSSSSVPKRQPRLKSGDIFGLSWLVGGFFLGAFELCTRTVRAFTASSVSSTPPSPLEEEQRPWVPWVSMMVFIAQFVIILRRSIDNRIRQRSAGPSPSPPLPLFTEERRGTKSRSSGAGRDVQSRFLMVQSIRLLSAPILLYSTSAAATAPTTPTNNEDGIIPITMAEGVAAVVLLLVSSQMFRICCDSAVGLLSNVLAPGSNGKMGGRRRRTTAIYLNGNNKGHVSRFVSHVLQDSKSKRLALFLAANLAFMLVEVGYGLWSNSLGLISDAGHMMTDCMALMIGLVATYMSTFGRDEVFTYGYTRFEVVSGFTNGVLLVFIAIYIFIESIVRLGNPEDVHGERLITVSVAGLLMNLVGLIFFHEHAHGGGGCSHSHGGGGETTAESSLAIQGIFLHILADTLGSVGVIVSSYMVKYWGWRLADPICSLCISFLILGSVVPLLQQSTTILLQGQNQRLMKGVRRAADKLVSLPGVLSYSKLHAWTLGSSSSSHGGGDATCSHQHQHQHHQHQHQHHQHQHHSERPEEQTKRETHHHHHQQQQQQQHDRDSHHHHGSCRNHHHNRNDHAAQSCHGHDHGHHHHHHHHHNRRQQQQHHHNHHSQNCHGHDHGHNHHQGGGGEKDRGGGPNADEGKDHDAKRGRGADEAVVAEMQQRRRTPPATASVTPNSSSSRNKKEVHAGHDHHHHHHHRHHHHSPSLHEKEQQHSSISVLATTVVTVHIRAEGGADTQLILQGARAIFEAANLGRLDLTIQVETAV